MAAAKKVDKISLQPSVLSSPELHFVAQNILDVFVTIKSGAQNPSKRLQLELHGNETTISFSM